MYIKQFEESGFMVFSYLVACGKTKEALVIDPAGDIDAIIAEAEKEDFRILQIVNTHGHVDHIMGNAELKKKTNASITIHEGDAEVISAVPPLKLQLFNAKASPPPDTTVQDNDIIKVGEGKLKVIHTPGHSPGSICLHLDGYLFTGDTLFVEGVGRTDLPYCSQEDLRKSIEKLKKLSEDLVLLPGHG